MTGSIVWKETKGKSLEGRPICGGCDLSLFGPFTSDMKDDEVPQGLNILANSFILTPN